LTLLKEGRDLIDYCARELDAVSSGLEQLRLDELVARLEAGGGAAPEQPGDNEAAQR
jgi:exodeoxyribonuclease VII small subunit